MDINNSNFHHDRPIPNDFNEFLPWACRALDIVDNIIITNVQTKFVSAHKHKHTKDKAIQHHLKTGEASAEKRSGSRTFKFFDENVNKVKITTIYDIQGNLLQLKFEKNSKLPRELFKILAMILTYHVHLTSISIDKGMDMAVLHELHNLAKLSITDICLDGTCISGANYDVLLDQSNLKNLSIARCNIDDDMIKTISEKITYPQSASKTLALLNLASNRITDDGAKSLAGALRSNRCLVYLNLSDNAVTDVGSFAILDVLDKFEVLPDEMNKTRRRYTQFWKENNPQNRKTDEEKKIISRKSIKTPETKQGKRSKLDKPITINKKLTSYDDDGFIDPFFRKSILRFDDRVYCYGNNQLAYLNISYNNITYFTVKKLLTVLKNQRSLNRKPRGLVHLAIEGNDIPITCGEYDEIGQIIQPQQTTKQNTTHTNKMEKMPKLKKKASM